MPRYDPELIAALADGTLDPEVAARLEREIAADPQSAAELAAQRAAREALQMAPPPRLSDAERFSLHEAVAAAVNLDLEPQAAAEPRPRRRVPWGPIAVAAASLAGLLVAVPLIGLLSVGGDDATLETVAFATTAAATPDPSTMPAAAPEIDEEMLVMADDAAENGEAGAPSEYAAEMSTTAPATTAAPETTIFRSRLDGEAVLEEFLADADLLAELQAEPPDGDYCVAEAGDLADDTLARATRFAAEVGDAVVWYTIGEDGAPLRVLVFDPVDCVLIAEGP